MTPTPPSDDPNLRKSGKPRLKLNRFFPRGPKPDERTNCSPCFHCRADVEGGQDHKRDCPLLNRGAV